MQFLKKKKLEKAVLRIHFQEFMAMIHEQINILRKKEIKNPLEIIGKKLSKDYSLICFDELEIIDIADAMIVSKLFKLLLEKKISFIITSNIKPDELYKSGLQREQFTPFIEIIKKEMSVIKVKNKYDLRKASSNLIKNKNHFFLYPLNNASKDKYLKILGKIKNNHQFKKKKIQSLGRILVLDQTTDNILFADFKFICSYKFSPNDYIAISDCFEWFFIDNIPAINSSLINEARRFIVLIDILYEKKSKLVVRAEKKIENIFNFKQNKDMPFLRTASRITEMTSKEWIRKKKGEIRWQEKK